MNFGDVTILRDLSNYFSFKIVKNAILKMVTLKIYTPPNCLKKVNWKRVTNVTNVTKLDIDIMSPTSPTSPNWR